MKYSEILKDKKLDPQQHLEFIDLLDLYAADDKKLKWHIAKLVNRGHFCEYTATTSIEGMKAVVYLGEDGEVIAATSMQDYLFKRGIIPEVAYKLIQEAYVKAKTCALERGFTAPPLDINEWDAYQAVAMILSDYWCSTDGNLEKVAMLAYEYLSDPDKKR